MSVKVTSYRSDVLKELSNAKTMALDVIGTQAVNYAFALAPHDTGRLRNSIDHKVISDEAVAIGTNVEYAPYQEFGTSLNPEGHPFLKPAVERHLNQYKAIAEKYLRGGL